MKFYPPKLFPPIKSSKDGWVYGLLLISIALVFWDLVTLNRFFLSGDHAEQQYPWAKYYQEQIRQFRLPWWTSQIHCGFPLLAEGQVGAFYPLNFLFLFFLPLRWAYNYEILFHYALGALFFYLLLRRYQVSRWGSFFACLIFLFGSTQGGYFYYNLISQRVVIWLPLTLLLIDRLCERLKFADAFFLSLVFTLQVFGGYLQVAIYSALYSCLYFLWRWLPSRNLKALFLFLSGAALAGFFSLVQLLPTYELSLFSARAGAEKGLAYVGSMSPLGLMTLFYPSWDGFLRSEFYIGLLGFYFLLFSFLSKKVQTEKFFMFALFFFILLALGKFSPLYVSIIELTRFGGFRTPIKFLFFAAFSGAVLAGFGFDKFFHFKEEFNSVQTSSAKLQRIYVALGSGMIVLPLIAAWVLDSSRNFILPILKQYVERHIYGQPGHPHAVEFYRDRVADYYDFVIQSMSLAAPHTLIEWTLLIFSLAAVSILWFFRGRLYWVKAICVGFLFVDLYFYGLTSIKANYNFEGRRILELLPGESRILDRLQKEKPLFRTSVLYHDPSFATGKFPFFPNRNMLYGIDDVGAYSPLVMKKYKAFLEGWGYVNDSLSVNVVAIDRLIEKIPELSLFNVKYIISPVELHHESLTLLEKEKGILLYQNERVLPRAFYLPGLKQLSSFGEVKKVSPVSVQSRDEPAIRLDHESSEDGLLVFSSIAYPGWEARVNGKKAPWKKAGDLFLSIPLEKGKHDVVFEYRPVFFERLGAIALSVIFLIGAIVLYRETVWTRREKVRALV